MQARRLLTLTAALGAAVVMTTQSITPAEAQYRPRGWHGGYYGGHYGYRSRGWNAGGALAAGAAIGLIGGAIAASAATPYYGGYPYGGYPYGGYGGYYPASYPAYGYGYSAPYYAQPVVTYYRPRPVVYAPRVVYPRRVYSRRVYYRPAYRVRPRARIVRAYYGAPAPRYYRRAYWR